MVGEANDGFSSQPVFSFLPAKKTPLEVKET
jgi:hypothetical protein